MTRKTLVAVLYSHLCVYFLCLAAATVERKKTKAEMTAEERREAKRKKRKAEFDAQYDHRIKDDDEFYQAWKGEMEQQAKVGVTLHFSEMDCLL